MGYDLVIYPEPETMTVKAINTLLFLVGLVNFLPVLGVLSGGRIAQAYGIELPGPDLEILLRHRALLFGIVGGFVFYALFVPAMQWPAIVMAGVSMVGFLVFMLQVGDYNASLYRVMLVDIAGIVLLLATVVLKLLVSRA